MTPVISKPCLCRVVLGSAFLWLAIAAAGRGEPRPGEVYREYAQHMGGNVDWRVTDPQAKAEGAKKFLPNPVLHLAVDDLEDAVRAEAILDRWGGHPRTSHKQIRFNGHDWITVPEPTTTPPGSTPEKFLFQDNPVLEIPLAHLKQGDNTFEGSCSTIENYNWGQWGLYSLILRVYYDPERKPHATGRIVSPRHGQQLAEDPTITLEANGQAAVARVDFLAFYDGLDEDGDGVYRQWHESYHQPERGQPAAIEGHAGTAVQAPYQVTWSTRWVPDQPPGSIWLIARLQDNSGVWFVTEPVQGLSLDRPDQCVKLYKASRVPEHFGVRVGKTLSCEIAIPADDDLSQAAEACLVLRTWHGHDAVHGPLRLNDWSSKIGGKNHHYSYNVHEVPVDVLRPGANPVQFHSSFKEHALEVLWPGPSLVVRYKKP